MRIPEHERDREFGSMTPMIDVVFLLLIFFVVTASSQIREAFLPTDLQKSGVVQSDLPPPDEETLSVDIWLNLRFDGVANKTHVDMNGTIYNDVEQLKNQLRSLAELGPENPVILDINADVPLGDIVDVYDTCQAGGFESVSFAADAPNSD